MNRKLGQLIKAALFALPLALPGVALAQSAGSTPPTSNGTYDNADKQNQAPLDKSMQDKNGAQPESSGVTGDTTEKTPPAGDLDTSGTSKTTDHNAVGGDINKPSKMDNDTTTTTTKHKKTIKKSTNDLDTGSNTGNDLNR
ncbi:MAG TPA: hypothetical protein VGL86_15975 [Polyangia bacterium]|jgi:hypothetical protein